MPRVLGIVAEYDPFHRGHARHLQEARDAVSPDSVCVALSPCFKQRGEAALLSPHDRAACVLAHGADAVVSLPVLWAVRDAEHYALGAVSLLASLGATHLAFGAETADLSRLLAVSDFLENPSPAYQERLKDFLSAGEGFPAAQARAAASFLSGAEEILRQPNNTLGICYLRIIRRLGLPLEPVVIPRRGAYHNPDIVPEAPSASALRAFLQRGWYAPGLPSVPSPVDHLIRRRFLEGSRPSRSVLDSLLISRLQTMTPEDFRLLPGTTEGLGDALRLAALHCNSREEIVSSLCSRRYPASRISRLCCHALLGIREEDLNHLPLPDQPLLLGIRPGTVLTRLWKGSPVRPISDASVWKAAASRADRLSWQLWAQACGLSPTLPMTEKIRTLS